MASEHSFDISAEVDMMEVKNALETAKKEIAARYDFKGLAAEVELNEKEKFITLLSSSDNKIDALKDIVISKLIKRNIPPVAITGKSIDDLQECIKLVRGLNLELPISFKNLK